MRMTGLGPRACDPMMLSSNVGSPNSPANRGRSREDLGTNGLWHPGIAHAK